MVSSCLGLLLRRQLPGLDACAGRYAPRMSVLISVLLSLHVYYYGACPAVKRSMMRQSSTPTPCSGEQRH
jgi:hypothetical protein